MAFDNKSMNALERQSYEASRMARQLKLDRVDRFLTELRYSFYALFKLPVWVVVMVVRLLSSVDGKKLGVWFSRWVLRSYYYNRGVDHYQINSLPKTLDANTVIFAVRDHPHSALFIHQLFSGVLIVPMLSFLHRFKTVSWFPFRFIAPFFKASSYTDQPLPVAIENVKTLVNKGYPTVVFINKDYGDSSSKNTLGYFRECDEFMNREDVTCYFLAIHEFDRHINATWMSPTVVGVDFKSQSELLGSTKPGSKAAAHRISEFFKFRYIKMES